ncbi:hypothetical protein I6F36_06430 [Bradyrhizobium sp. BRP19]|uniref:hypothetical protein n=1 Tax=Bradyrhizobium sp. BRP19 TaxID=2793823 RepID=UPI001CD77BFA|nr:hypothetical protein [Bradyrhizobium sp. BRP19]MCA1546441.1 hypothetical protein [Bradyrhizobium sp. BRP19]
MSEEQTTQTVVDETEVPATPGMEAASSRNDDGLDALLSDFDRSRSVEKTAPAEPAPQEQPRAEIPANYSEDDLMRLQLSEISNRVVMENLLNHQIATSQRLQFEEWQRNEKADFAETVQEAASMLEDFPHVGDAAEFARRWLLSEAQLDPALYEAWQHRRDSKEHWQHAERALARACKKMIKEVARFPDPELSADRALVASVMRGGSGKPPPAETSAAYSRRVASMNDADFQAESDRLMGR